MTTNAASIDRSTTPFPNAFSATVGAGGVTQGHAVMFSGAANSVIQTTGQHSVAVGIAMDTVSSGSLVAVMPTGGQVEVPYTLTLGARVGCAAAGALNDWTTSGTVIGVVSKSATSASWVIVNLSYETV